MHRLRDLVEIAVLVARGQAAQMTDETVSGRSRYRAEPDRPVLPLQTSAVTKGRPTCLCDLGLYQPVLERSLTLERACITYRFWIDPRVDKAANVEPLESTWCQVEAELNLAVIPGA